MKLQYPNALPCALLLSAMLVSCGNKGDLFLVPDPINRQDMEQLQRVLNTDDIPTADAVDVDDQAVYEKPVNDDDKLPGMSPVDK